MPAKARTVRETIPVCQPFFWGGEADAVQECLANGWLTASCPPVRNFERAFARYQGGGESVAVMNGTCALELAFELIDLRDGDEVIVPDFCMISPIFALSRRGARPIPVDADETWNMDPAQVASKITAKTRAILAVHTYGYPANVIALSRLAREHSLVLVEDVAEALGAEFGGVRTGTVGDVSCFSFYANKIITMGEGGVLHTHRRDWANRARSLSNMCFGPAHQRFVHESRGHNFRITSLQAAIGLKQLEHVEEAIEAKIEIARHYDRALAGVPGIETPPRRSDVRNVYWVYGIVVDPAFGMSRDQVSEELAARGIETRSFFSPVHSQPFLAPLFEDSLPRESFPHCQRLASRGLYLPSFVGLDVDRIQWIADQLCDLRISGATKSRMK